MSPSIAKLQAGSFQMDRALRSLLFLYSPVCVCVYKVVFWSCFPRCLHIIINGLDESEASVSNGGAVFGTFCLKHSLSLSLPFPLCLPVLMMSDFGNLRLRQERKSFIMLPVTGWTGPYTTIGH